MRIKVLPIDRVFSRLVRLRAEGRCEYCGKAKAPGELECSHYIGRRNRATRWDPDNAAGLCFSCHVYLGENPYQHTEWFRRHLGSERFESLVARAEMPGPKPTEVNRLLAHLRQLVAAEDV